MEAKDIFAGPIVRRAQQDKIAIWVATRRPFALVAQVRPVGVDEWTGESLRHDPLQVFQNLYVHLLIVEPYEAFPTNTLLEYSIAVLKSGLTEDEEFGGPFPTVVADHSFFEKIVQVDKLSYPGFAFPTLYLQDPAGKLCALYASCRKIHDTDGGPSDALALGDDLIAKTPRDFSRRPAVLVLGGDQIYADDVHDNVFDEVTKLAKEIAGGAREALDEQPRSLIGKGQRGSFVRKYGSFTSGHADNHLITLAEYAAMYGLAWCPHNWSRVSYREEIQSFVNALPKVRRLMANTPTYMIFDDHDVTDDWNLSIRWKNDVWASPYGRRIVASALYCFWLFQAWGNDPDRHREWLQDIKRHNDNRGGQLGRLVHPFEKFFWQYDAWEFSTPTRPFIYALDTRTQRGYRDGFRASDSSAPAFLKSIDSWKRTMAELARLLRGQSKDYPLVLLAPAPVFGFSTIDALQKHAATLLGASTVDLEAWARNLSSLLTFLRLCGDYNIVLLSGDVHYAYTSTVKFSNFDHDSHRAFVRHFPQWSFPKTGAGPSPTYQFLYASKHIQLTSSAAKNYASVVLEKASGLSRMHSYVVNNAGEAQEGTFQNGELRIAQRIGEAPTALVPVGLEDYKPRCALLQRYNDAFNTPYIGEHNIGFVRIHKKQVENSFLTSKGEVGKQTWDFLSELYWEVKDRGF